MKKFYFVAALTTLMTLSVGNVFAETVKYAVNTTTSVTTSGTAPTYSSATYRQTYTTKCQLTKNNSATLTLSGFAGNKITGIVLNMKSNSKSGSGTFSVVAGTTSIASISEATDFNNWYDNTAYSTSSKDITVLLTNSAYAIQEGDIVVITISCTANSLYIQSYTITYESACTKHNVTVSSDICGTVNATPTSACEGKEVTLSYTENDGYYFNNYQVDGSDITGSTFTMPDADVTVKGLFSSCDQLSVPTNVKTSSVTTTSATITWDAVDNATGGYKVYIMGDDYEKETTVTTTTYSLSGLTANTEYVGTITAIGDGHRYCESAEAEVDFSTSSLTKLATPDNLTISNLKYSSATITWDAVEHATKYEVSITDANNKTTTYTATLAKYDFTGLTENSYYIVSVKAIGDNTTYSDSEEATKDFTTPVRQKYTLTFSDQGGVYKTEEVYEDATVSQPTTPTGVCTEPVEYVFDGWSATEVTDGTTSYTKVDFSKYTMPKGGATLYAVYKYAADGSSTDTFKKGSLSDLTDGQQVVIVKQNSSTALNSTVYSTYYLTATSVTISSENTITTSTSELIWTIEKSGNYYIFKQGDNYLNITSTSSKYYNLKASTSTTANSWIIASNGDGYSLQNVKYSKYYAVYNSTYTEFTTSTTADELQFYVRSSGKYTSAPLCGVYITGTKGIQVTSAKDIWVEAADTMEVSATSLDKNEDGAAVSISAEVTSGNFTIKTAGTSGSGSSKLTLVTNCTDAAYSQKLVVVYTPTADNTTETGQILLRVCKTDGTTEYATATIDVQGRSLPEQFVIAAKTTDGWVALPSDLGTGSSSTVKAPYAITVDDESNPTKATQAPTTALYKGAERNAANTCANAIRFMSVSNNAYLQASTAANNTGIWLSTTNSNEAQPWKLTSSNFADYNVRVEKSETGRYLGYDATQGKIANYKQTATLRFLPIAVTCTRYDAPTITSTTAATDKVTLTWTEISGAAEYEYSSEQTTWTTIGSVTTVDGVTTAVISGLAATTDYTYYIRVKTTGENCSEVAKVTFTTTDCEDVPNNLSAYASSNSVTISWTANAATSTVKIYSDAAGTTEVVSKTDAKSPCDLMGLKQNTKYYYQVFAGGSCKSAIETFTTETSAISVVEWFQDSLIVNVNTEGSDVSVVIEGQKAHGDAENKNIAEDLFFSKYYEATGNVKLIGIYNGTLDTLSLEKIQINIGKTKWHYEIPMSSYGKKKTGYIAPNEEIILWYSASQSNDNKITSCVEEKGYVDFTKMESNGKISFSGDQTITLLRDSKLIDVLGAVKSDGSPVQGKVQPSWGDDPGWAGKGYNIENQTEEIDLSTNRCLLVRSNKVKSGKNAVTNNVDTFMTFTKAEWLGRPVSKYKSDGSDDKGVESSCEGFAYVADFNYNDYYTAYDSIGGLRELNGHQNPDGTYTIPATRIDTLACQNIRLQVKDNGAVVVSKEQRVPIMVVKNTNTMNDTLFISKHTEDECKTCDVVVRNEATLSHVNGGRKEFRDMYIYAGSRLSLPAGETFTLQTTHMHAKNDSVSYAIINNDNTTITINKLVHVKRIDGKYWYPFALPYDCKIADIKEQCGLDLGTYGTDWGIKYYDGEKRQSDGNSMTTFGEVSKYWTMMSADATLKANTGYIIGLFYENENLMRSIYFTPAGTSNYVENGDSKTTQVTNWPHNLTAEARHHGWNFVGSPYISLFGNASDGEGIYNSSLKMGYTMRDGTQADKEHIYVSIPDGGNKNTYTQALTSVTTIKPFSAYFVQAVDPTDGTSHQLDLTYSKGNRSLPNRIAMAENASDEPIMVELTVTGADATMKDNAGIWMSDQYTTDYEIGDDLYKMYAESTKPQLYTTDATGLKMAYLAIPDQAMIPMGLYAPKAGTYTLSINDAVSQLGSAQAVYLQYNGAIVADLMSDTYAINATKSGTVSGYSLSIKRAPHTTTAIDNTDAPHAVYQDGRIVVSHLSAGATVRVYDVLGHLYYNETINGDGMTAANSAIEVPATVHGVYTVVVANESAQTVLKTLAY